LLDEPTTGVDVVSRKEFWHMLKKLKQEGLTIMVATPYMDEAMLCDRVALMQDGRIMDIDTPTNIITKNKEALWAVKAPSMFTLLQSLRNCEAVESAYLFGEFYHVTPKPGFENGESIRVWLLEQGHNKAELNMITPNIEDIFMHLMKTEKHEA
jgi:ABC-type multidrug transport system ATPase subunit